MNAGNAGLVNALRGPVIMITIGVLFLLDKFTALQFGQTWPFILIVVGVLTLAGRGQGAQPPSGPPLGNSPGYVSPPPHNPPPPGVRR